MRMWYRQPAKAALLAGSLPLLSVPALAGTDMGKAASAPVTAPASTYEQAPAGAVRDSVNKAISHRLFTVLDGLGDNPAGPDALRRARSGERRVGKEGVRTIRVREVRVK